jgi:hypothetical protein
MTAQDKNRVTPDEVRAEIAAEIGISRIDLKAPPHKFGEVMEEIAPQGVKTKLAEWEDKTIVIHTVRFFQGKFGPAAYILFTDANGELFNTVLSQKIVLPKLAGAVEFLPLECTVVKKEGGQFGEYWDLE